MIDTLYSRDILKLASQLEYRTEFSKDLRDYSIGYGEMKSPICGSIIIVKAALRQDIILDALFDIKSCAMGQASAALLIKYMVGKNYDTIFQMRSALKARLEGMNAKVDAYPQLNIMDIATGYSARHGAILLPYDSLLKAMNYESL